MTHLDQGSTDMSVTLASDSSEPVVDWMAEADHHDFVASRQTESSGRGQSRTRRPQASRRAGEVLVVAAGLSGAATAGSATGIPPVDRLLRGGLAATVAAAASTAPTWAIVVLATGAAGLGWTGGPLAAASGIAALTVAFVLAWKEDVDRHLLKGASGALSATALLRVPGGVLGATAAVTGLLAGMILLTGLWRGHRRWRRRAAFAAAALVGLGVVATALGSLAGLAGRSSFQRSSTSVSSALEAAKAGDSPKAAESARAAAADLKRAHSSLNAWWARPGWAVPILGAHLRAADRVASSASPAVDAAPGSAGALRLDALRSDTGQLDLNRIGEAEPELNRLSIALHDAQRGVVDGRSPWLAPPFKERLERYEAELADVTVTTDRALLAVRAVPGLLGRDRPTRWFVAVANPAESRELGGFIGDYAVLVADRGNLRLERTGGVRDIGAYVAGRELKGIDLPDRYLSQRPELFWQNLSGYPDLPTVANAARSLWDQVAPGSPLDGVAYVDPHGLAALLRITGPVQAPAPLGTFTADNVARLLLSEQYERFDDQEKRYDTLNDASKAIFTALSGSPLPSPGEIGAALGPAARGGHLLAASFSTDGQRLFDEIGAGGRLPASEGGDLASLRTTNLLENKLDAHLHRSVNYRAVVNPGTRRVEATATVELRSDARADLPDYVAANRRGLPKGTNLLEVAWYSGLALERMEVDGRQVTATSDRERGWWTHSAGVEVPPGASVKVVLHLAGQLRETRPYRLDVAPQATVHDDSYAVEVVGTGRWSAGPVRQPRPARQDVVTVDLNPR